MRRTSVFVSGVVLSILVIWPSGCVKPSAVLDECPLPSQDAVDRIELLCPSDRMPTPENAALCFWLADVVRTCGW